MELKHLIIKNFRNFKNLNIDLTNRNIIFGLNDIGKSNFLAALRFLLDRNFRKNGFIDSDFYNKDITKEIIITLEVKVSDEEDDEDSKKIFKMMKGAIDSKSDTVFFQLKTTFDSEKSVGEPTMFWGIDVNDLEDIPSRQSYFEIDKYINVIYIDSSIKLESTFKQYSREIFRKESSLEADERKKLVNNIDKLNTCVSKLNAIKELKSDLVEEYKKFRNEKGFELAIKSEIEIDNLHDKLTPYILDNECKTYPTAGDGRKKILSYTLLTLENRRKEDEMINVFLVEELENHLHRSMQLSLSYEIFSDNLFRYLFLTTHSSLIVSQMDQVNLIKLVKECAVVGKSFAYSVPSDYKKLKQKLNQNLAEAIYADVVLLVEGPSEKTLFERILYDKCERYESLGGYILEVEGINFKEYYDVLIALGIDVIIRTDNDLKLYEKTSKATLLGVNRCLNLLGKETKPNIIIDNVSNYKTNISVQIDKKREVFDQKYPNMIKNFTKKNIYLSRVDLENDLYEAIPNVMDDLSKENNSSMTGVDYLQTAKLKNMIKLCQKLNKQNVNSIYNHDRFECLRKLVELCCQ
ncbi:AAA family ATPase [Niameybacter massiliensis]|uniref:AAA family ATPase n=1 Tax=Holtiella tumoricola TaxID=3018743 RepID=A0AA42DMN8_9FIRM|nr:AAA family ATPase [Holtiella tumoricola]MDA3731592.1 AAA family ATPase [Holtiella tumoricola]